MTIKEQLGELKLTRFITGNCTVTLWKRTRVLDASWQFVDVYYINDMPDDILSLKVYDYCYNRFSQHIDILLT